MHSYVNSGVLSSPTGISPLEGMGSTDRKVAYLDLCANESML